MQAHTGLIGFFSAQNVPRAALRSALGYLLLPLWGGRIDPSPPGPPLDFPWQPSGDFPPFGKL
jgi:hypothetical protein